MNKNRDYFTRPYQGSGRDHHDYGNTHLGKPPRDPWMRPTLIGVGLVVLYFAWQFARVM